jgi:sulfite exporter TauE/SafE
VRKIMISSTIAIAAALAGVSPAAASGTPQSPQGIAEIISCPGMAPFPATSPTLPSAVAVGQPVAVIPGGIIHGQMPSGLVMSCSLTVVSNGEIFTGVPILIAPTTH